WVNPREKIPPAPTTPSRKTTMSTNPSSNSCRLYPAEKDLACVGCQKFLETLPVPRHFYRVVQGIFFVCKFYVSRNVQILLHSAGVCDVGRSSLAYQQVIQKDVTGSVIPLEKQLRLAQHPAVKARRKLVGVGGRGLRKHPLFDWLY